ncbi:MAG: flagellar export chaperone FlgN [Alkalispirochaeta sp.]
MEHTHAIHRFIDLLNQQAELIGQLASYEGTLQEVVAQRNWAQLEQMLPVMTQVSEAINEIEARRNEQFSEIAATLGGEESFARVLSRLPEELRSELSSAYRALKVSVLALQSRTAGMDAYIRATISTTRGVLQELYPEHMSSGYSRDGQGRFGTAPAAMFDHAQ